MKTPSLRHGIGSARQPRSRINPPESPSEMSDKSMTIRVINRPKGTVYNFVIVTALFLVSCSPYYKYYPFELADSGPPPQKVFIAPLNLIEGTKKELVGKERCIDSLIKDYLTGNGKTCTKNNALFLSTWKAYLSAEDGIYDKNSGIPKVASIEKLLSSSVLSFCKTEGIDAVIFPSIVQRNAYLSGQFSYWDGVRRELIVESPFQSPQEYTWSGDVKALSMKIVIYKKEGTQYFKSFGGIDLITKIGYEGIQPRAISIERPFQNIDHIQESLNIAFHPYIDFGNYPKKVLFESSDEDSSTGIIIIPTQNSNLRDMKKFDKF
jgi:hypothetical protein